MTGRLEGCKVARWMILGMFLSNIPTVNLSAQVGHNPATSPYRDIALHPGPMFFVGHLGADRGNVGVGTSNALTYGARYELPAGRVVQFQFTGAYLRGDRFLVNPYADSNSASRRTAPAKSDLLQVEIGMQLRLTGGKTWRGLAPVVGTGLGLIAELNAAADTSGYRCGTKFPAAFAPGLRWYPARRSPSRPSWSDCCCTGSCRAAARSVALAGCTRGRRSSRATCCSPSPLPLPCPPRRFRVSIRASAARPRHWARDRGARRGLSRAKRALRSPPSSPRPSDRSSPKSERR